MAILYPQVRDNFPKFREQIRRWKRKDKEKDQMMSYQIKVQSRHDDVVMESAEDISPADIIGGRTEKVEDHQIAPSIENLPIQ